MADPTTRRRLGETSMFLEPLRSSSASLIPASNADDTLKLMARNLVAVYEINGYSPAALVKAIRRQDLCQQTFRHLLIELEIAMVRGKLRTQEIEEALRYVKTAWTVEPCASFDGIDT